MAYYRELVEKKIEDDDLIIKHKWGESRLGDIRKMEEKWGAGKEELRKVLLFWDDTVQFTTLGLIDVLLDEPEFEDISDEDKVWDYSKFFYRGIENTDTDEFVIRLIKELYNKEVTYEKIRYLYATRYLDILKRSPVSNVMITIITIEQIYDRIHFVFKGVLEEDEFEELIISFKNRLVRGETKILTYDTLLNYDFDDMNLLKTIGKEYDFYVHTNLGNVHIFIEEEEKMNAIMLGPNKHNGIPEDILMAYYFIHGQPNRGPYNAELILYNEGYSVC